MLTKTFTFRPPKNNRVIIGLAKQILPLMLRSALKIRSIEISEQDIKRLRELDRQRVILTPSHSGRFEPSILFYLSKILDMDFNYLASKETFEQFFPFSWLIQWFGAYSIVRGTPDRNSFRMTRQLLAEGKRWLVIFPEGEVSGHNDTLMPFQQGVAQLAFWACEDLAGQGDSPPLYLVPIAIKYIYLGTMYSEIDLSLMRLERKLFLPKPQSLTLYDRLRRIGEVLLNTHEREYNVRPKEGATLDERIHHIKELIISRVALAAGVSFRQEQPLSERIRDLINAMDRIIYSEHEGSDYERQLHLQRQQEVSKLYDELYRVLRFVSLRDGYVRETMTAERFLDVIGLLETEVLGRKKIRGPRKAIVKIGEPLNLKGYFSHYQRDKRKAIQEVTLSLESSVRRMLTDMTHLCTPIEPE